MNFKIDPNEPDFLTQLDNELKLTEANVNEMNNRFEIIQQQSQTRLHSRSQSRERANTSSPGIRNSHSNKRNRRLNYPIKNFS